MVLAKAQLACTKDLNTTTEMTLGQKPASMLTRRDLGKHTSKCYSGNLHFLLQCFQETGDYNEELKEIQKIY